jgi:hypothetical protein
MVACTYHPSYVGSINRRMVTQATPGINVRHYMKNPRAKRAGSMAQVVDCLYRLWQPLVLFLSLWIHLFWTFHKNGIILQPFLKLF